MSMTSNLVEELRKYAEEYRTPPWGNYNDGKKETLRLASDTIEELSLKLHNSQMERSSMYYNGGWIPVEERLPEDDVAVLVTYVEKGNKCFVGMTVARYSNVYFGGNILNIKEWKPMLSYFGNEDEVIAWQPLPPAYEPKGE